jgi:hypothetical protein
MRQLTSVFSQLSSQGFDVGAAGQAFQQNVRERLDQANISRNLEQISGKVVGQVAKTFAA